MVDMDGSANISLDTLGTYIIFNHVMFQVSLHILGFNVGSATHHLTPGANYEYCVQYSSGETTFLPVFCRVSFESLTLLMIYLSTLSIWLGVFGLSFSSNLIFYLWVWSPLPLGSWINHVQHLYVDRSSSLYFAGESSLPCISASFMWLKHYWTDTDMYVMFDNIQNGEYKGTSSKKCGLLQTSFPVSGKYLLHAWISCQPILIDLISYLW